MNIEERTASLAYLGNTISKKLSNGAYDAAIARAYHENQWFTPDNIKKALSEISSHFLDEAAMKEWLRLYNGANFSPSPSQVGIVMAGNIPLVGWHDVQCVLMSGHKAMVKLSSKDEVLPRLLIGELIEIEPRWQTHLQVADKLQGYDAVIATGSNNTMRYFEYYFGNVPSILRKNRNSIAILTGNESPEELNALGEDIFAYFGLGCRNVSKIYVPQEYNFTPFYESIESYKEVMDHHKYQNNYLYNKSLLLLNKEKHLDNNFLLIKEAAPIASPMSILHFEPYSSLDEVNTKVEALLPEIQCIVGRPETYPAAIPFGTTQQPELWDYADGVDTMQFLLSL
jgi:hypothetical protein